MGDGNEGEYGGDVHDSSDDEMGNEDDILKILEALSSMNQELCV